MKFFQKAPKPQKLDYRLRIFHVLLRQFKACRLFLIQKAVKRLRLTQKPAAEAHLMTLKQLKSNDLKIFSIFLMKQQGVELGKVNDDLNKLVPGYEGLIEELGVEKRKIVGQMEALNAFKSAKEEIGKIMGNVRKRIEKTKVSRKALKEKHRKKRENRENPVAAVVELKDEGKKREGPRKPFYKENKRKGVFEKPKEDFEEPKKKFSDISGKNTKNFELKRKDIDFQSQNHNISSETSFLQKNPFLAIPKPNADKLTTDYEGIHPSWQASLERRQAQHQGFQGTRRKLI